MLTNLGACRTHEGGSGANKSAQQLTRRGRKTARHPVPPGDRTQDLRIGIPTRALTTVRSHVPRITEIRKDPACTCSTG